MELIDKHEFAKTTLDECSEIFVVYVIILNILELALYPSQALLLAALQQDKAPIKISPEYADYVDVFSPDLAIELPENTGINKHAIELIYDKQLPYGSIYSLSPVELENLKSYIETHLKTGFIRPSKSPAGAFIFFDKKPNDSLHLCVAY